MAYDKYLVERIRHLLQERHVEFYEKEMMGALMFMVRERMCFGIHYSKKHKEDLLFTYIGEEGYTREIEKPCIRPMDFSGRPSKGGIYIDAQGWDMEDDLVYWVDLGLDWNAQL